MAEEKIENWEEEAWKNIAKNNEETRKTLKTMKRYLTVWRIIRFQKMK